MSRPAALLPWLAAAAVAVAARCAASPIKAVVTIIIDDLGYHDLGYRGSGVATPNLDRLHGEGIDLSNYYVIQICTPSRGALLTGRYPLRLGLQGGMTIQPQQTWGLPLNETTLADVATGLGWDARAIGKWHLGGSSWSQTPTFRGFSSFYGYYLGAEDYYAHTVGPGYDLHRDGRARCGEGCSVTDWGGNGTYSAFLFAAEAAAVIANHSCPASGSGSLSTAGSTSSGCPPPLFLYLAMQSVHSPVQAPDSYVQPYRHVFNDSIRATHAGMLAVLDEAVGNVTAALEGAGLMDGAVIVVTTDNGGPSGTTCGDCNGALNFPLRGGKHSLFQGGVKGTSFVWSRALYGTTPANRSYAGLMHITDWLPTVVSWMGGTYTPAPGFGLDGYDQSGALAAAAAAAGGGEDGGAEGTTGAPLTATPTAPSSPRPYSILNIDPTCGGMAGVVQGEWKLLLGDPGPPYGWDPATEVSLQAVEGQGQSVSLAEGRPGTPRLRVAANDFAPFSATGAASTTAPGGPCSQSWPPTPPITRMWPPVNTTVLLFNLTADPREMNNVAQTHPSVVSTLTALLQSYALQAVRPVQNATNDPAGASDKHNGTWVPWMP